ncbi:Uncharacterized protein BC141101_05648 [Bacillus toyonensis]|uniref:hypothetical protein n=2 Tax=Bacillus TaxID=1386 RepID=UPI0002E240F6|nr:hypothetical protein [Bacillus wiedmannii]PED75485.1 hypothetical protein CON88_23395 [Bacillus toyonensis]PFW02704.1 hypothetical protein COL12_29440 [Bacillus cereus]MDI6680297.1 hypothetical protein [Bacillus wiedmannii]PHD79359.1 hypothetical protein COF50_28555 [Bacillus toyonensis]SCN20286.1 Uncharacterized protein BC141101_05648 [Bacillus toyonensis]
MIIKDILELTQTMRVSEIAKEFLEVGEKKAVEGLKKAGCYNTSGKRGWYLTEGIDESVLEQSIYDFVAPTKGKAKAVKSNASISASKEIASTVETPVKESKVTSETSKTPVKASKKTVASELDSIDVLLLQNQEESENRTYRGFYWDKDIISFLDGIKHGNKSDLMNEIVRTVLKDKGLL